jgi:hypothetical protein
LTVQLPTPEARFLLRNRELTIDRGDECVTTIVAADELLDLLASRFRLRLPSGTTFPQISGEL